MKLLMDTHAILWWLEDRANLSETARDAISDPANIAFVSAVTRDPLIRQYGVATIHA